MKIDKVALTKAVGLTMLSWAALPFIYYLLVRKKKEVKEENGTTPGGRGEDSILE